MNEAVKMGLNWMSQLRDKYGEEKAMKIIEGFHQIYDVLEKQDEDVRNNILGLFVEIASEIKKDKP